MKVVDINLAFQFTDRHCDSLLHTQPFHRPLALVNSQNASTLGKETQQALTDDYTALYITESESDAVNKPQKEEEWHHCYVTV